jgi:hypothetical protein
VTESNRAEQRSSPSIHRQDVLRSAYARKHLRFGWWALFVFATLGLVLELLHGFKVQAYLAVSNETRRLMWTLAHAHGVLLAVINIILGLTLEAGRLPTRSISRVSIALMAAAVLLPGGFFAAGIAFYEGDPGVGVVIVPLGAVLLLIALFTIARDAGHSERT